ncbi:NUDIX hydrolase [Nanobdella aerobiophila]|nr:NUDIX hydrolase [Nanobdella aerobiophila]
MKSLEGGGAVGIILKEDKILLDLRKRSNGANLWEIAGGGIEKDETPEEAVIRELKEELDINVNKIRYLGAKNHAVHWGNLEIEHYFLIEEYNGNPIPKSKDELIEVRWFRINDLPFIINLGWRVFDAMFFLSKINRNYKRIYNILSNNDPRPLISYPYFSYSGTIYNLSDINIEDHIKGTIEGCKGPVLCIYPRYDKIISNLLDKFGTIDVLELNPDYIFFLKNRYGNKIEFIDGLAEKFKSNKKYGLILAINILEYIKDIYSFLSNVRSSIEKEGYFILTINSFNLNFRKLFNNKKIEIDFLIMALENLGFKNKIIPIKLGKKHYIYLVIARLEDNMT